MSSKPTCIVLSHTDARCLLVFQPLLGGLPSWWLCLLIFAGLSVVVQTVSDACAHSTAFNCVSVTQLSPSWSSRVGAEALLPYCCVPWACFYFFIISEEKEKSRSSKAQTWRWTGIVLVIDDDYQIGRTGCAEDVWLWYLYSSCICFYHAEKSSL